MKKIIISLCVVITISLIILFFCVPRKLVQNGSMIGDIVARYVFSDGDSVICLTEDEEFTLRETIFKCRIRPTLDLKNDKSDTIILNISVLCREKIKDLRVFVNKDRCWVEGMGLFSWSVTEHEMLYEAVKTIEQTH